MKQYKVTFIKIQKVIANQNTPVHLLEQIIETDQAVFDIPVMAGYAVMSICELLPKHIIQGNENEKRN